MAQDPNRVIAGSRLEIRIEDTKVGRITDFGVNRPQQLAVVEELGDPDPVEIEVLGRGAVSVSLSGVVLDRKSLGALGIMPRGTATGGAVIDFAAKPLVIYDNILDRAVLRVEGCRIESQDYRGAARALMTQQATLRGTKLFEGDDA